MLQGWGKGFTGEAISQDVKKNLISIIDEPSPPKQQTAEELKVGEGSLGEEEAFIRNARPSAAGTPLHVNVLLRWA